MWVSNYERSTQSDNSFVTQILHRIAARQDLCKLYLNSLARAVLLKFNLTWTWVMNLIKRPVILKSLEYLSIVREFINCTAARTSLGILERFLRPQIDQQRMFITSLSSSRSISKFGGHCKPSNWVRPWFEKRFVKNSKKDSYLNMVKICQDHHLRSFTSSSSVLLYSQ